MARTGVVRTGRARQGLNSAVSGLEAGRLPVETPKARRGPHWRGMAEIGKARGRKAKRKRRSFKCAH